MNSSFLCKTIVVVFAALCAVPPVLSAAPKPVTYTITDLGVIGTVQTDSASIARAINNHGQITGNATITDGDVDMFLYDGTMHDLGPGYGYGINDNGIVVGQQGSADVPCYNANHTATGQVVIPQIDPTGIGGIANAINNNNVIVGDSDSGGQEFNAFAYPYPSGPVTDLGYYETPQNPTEKDYSGVTAINSSGLMVGYGQVLVYDSGTGEYNPYYSGVVFSGGQVTLLPALSAGMPSYCNGLNDAGVAVGNATDSGDVSRPVFWSGEGVTSLGNYVGTAYGINDAGQIVGAYFTNNEEHAFVYTGGQFVDLNNATGGKMAGFQYLAYARAINNSGSIVGEGYTPGPNGGVRGPFAFLAVPSVATVNPPAAGTGTLVVSSADEAPGVDVGEGGATFSAYGPPAIDAAGDVAFHATVKGTSLTTKNDAGIWLYQGTNGALVAITGAVAPGTEGALFTVLSDPVLSGTGELAFLGTYSGGTAKVKSASGIFVTKDGITSLVVAVGDTAPGFSGGDTVTFASFTELAVANGGGVAFEATISGKINRKTISKTDGTGIWATDKSEALELVAVEGEDVPSSLSATVTGFTAFSPLAEVGGQSRSLDTLLGNLSFLAASKTPTESLLQAKVTTAAFEVANVVSVGSVVPGVPEVTLGTMDEPIINSNGTVAFMGTISGSIAGKALTKTDDSVIGIAPLGIGTDLALAVQAGVTLAPDATGDTSAGDLFSTFSSPALDKDNDLAFIGTLATAGDANKTNSLGIWEESDGTLKRVVRAGDNAPGSEGTFAAFDQLVLPDVGGPIFTATLSGSSKTAIQGLWAVLSGGSTPTSIIQDGNTLDVHGTTKTVSSFSIFSPPAVVGGQSRSFDASTENMVYVATFTDKTTGIYTVLPVE